MRICSPIWAPRSCGERAVLRPGHPAAPREGARGHAAAMTGAPKSPPAGTHLAWFPELSPGNPEQVLGTLVVPGGRPATRPCPGALGALAGSLGAPGGARKASHPGSPQLPSPRRARRSTPASGQLGRESQTLGPPSPGRLSSQKSSWTSSGLHPQGVHSPPKGLTWFTAQQG